MNYTEGQKAKLKDVADRMKLQVQRSQPSLESSIEQVLEDVVADNAMSSMNLHMTSHSVKELVKNILILLDQNGFVVPIDSTFFRSIYSAEAIMSDQRDYYRSYVLAKRLSTRPTDSSRTFMERIVKDGYSLEVLYNLIESATPYINNTDELSTYGEWLKRKLNEPTKKGMLQRVFGGGEAEPNFLDIVLPNDRQQYGRNIYTAVRFLLQECPTVLAGNEDRLLKYTSHQGQVILDLNSCFTLLQHDANKYAGMVEEAMSTYHTPLVQQLALYLEMEQQTGRDYAKKIIFTGDQYMHVHSRYSAVSNTFEQRAWRISGSQAYLSWLLQKDKSLAKEKLSKHLQNSGLLFLNTQAMLLEELGVEALPYVMPQMLTPSNGRTSEYYYRTYFENLHDYDLTPYKEDIIAFLLSTTNKKIRLTGCLALSKLGDNIKPDAINLLQGKVVTERILGTYILSHMGDDAAVLDVLRSAVDTERNDETRNIMLEVLAPNRFAAPYSKEQVLQMVELADRRKKLNRWAEKTIEEEKLIAPYWQDGSSLTAQEVRWLLYRTKQPKGLNSDIEAKQMLALIDRDRSEKTAMQLLQAFIDSNADSKLKYYLTLCGLLGSDAVLSKLYTLFRKSIADKRVKMAEYVLGAIAMIGSDKALRILEVISRKYANKKPKLAAAALSSLDVAAEELGITKDQLADRIIPNFDFDGLYREFEVEGETYRAFINTEFKLVYLNEANKLRKSVPPATAAELKKEFREIAKEVRDLVKGQGGRLETYMINGREWPAEEWKAFFFQNPIMFIYAVKLLWVKVSEDGHSTTVYYCDEDGDCYDIEDEEVEIADTDTVSILHPLMLDPDTLMAWKTKTYDEDIETIFPILQRPVVAKNEAELDKHFTVHFQNQKIPKGADFVAPQLLKRGWYKNPSDGGRLEFTKVLRGKSIITAYANIEGPAVYYQGGEQEATVYEVSFIGASWKDKVLIGEVPDVFYSEVMADIQYLIEAQ